MAHLPPCDPDDQRCGNIVLLHDGGGNRAETVRALPMIIDGLRQRGYQIVPVSQLAGQAVQRSHGPAGAERALVGAH